MFENETKILVEKITNAQSIAIVGHKNPDLDSMGSMLGLAKFIEQNYNKNCTCIYDGNLPEFMSYLPGRDGLVYVEKLPQFFRTDLLIVLDTANPDRLLGNYGSMLLSSADFVVKIDHHPNSVPFGDLMVEDSLAASTAEIIYDIAICAGWTWGTDTANLLLAAIIGDTMQFMFARRGSTFRVAADLVDFGANMEWNLNNIDVKPKKHILAEGKILSNAEIYGDLAVALVPNAEYKKLDGKAQDVIDLLRKIPSVEYIALLTQAHDDEVRIAFRSKTKPVNKIATDLFSGGGHEFAAGGIFYGKLEDAKESVKKAFRK